MAYLVERSMNGGAMRLSTHGTTGGDAIGGATDNTVGPKADEAPRSQQCHSCPPHRAPQWPLPPLSLTPPNRATGMQDAQLRHEERGAREGLHPSL